MTSVNAKPIATVKSTYANSFVANESPMIAVIDNVISPEECAHVIALAKDKLARARVSVEGDGAISEGRTGSNHWLTHNVSDVTQQIAERIAKIVGIPLSHAESFQVIHYGEGQQYKGHYDAYDLSTERGQHYCKNGGQRLVTAIAYLNDDFEGGPTRFSKLNKEIPAKSGRLAIFHNCLDNSTEVHPMSLHAGSPVEKGEKWAFNLWFHARPMTEIQTFSDSSTQK